MFASSNAVITTSSLVANVPFAGSTPATNTLTAVTVTVADVNANSMATGSTIVISAIDDGLQVPGYATGASCILRSTASHTVGNTVSPTVVGVTLVACTAGDQFRVVVTSPSGFTTERFFTVQ